ncbi:MAG: insulinase family protein [Oscillospiraceae bacterium]|nr:insulinase family protein [Oscillospiraceae bacterium]
MDVLNRKEIAPGVFFSKVTDARFKQNRISVNFLTQLSDETASANAVVTKVLTNSCRNYPDLRSLNAKLSSLYAASLSESVGNLGDTQFLEVAIKTIDTRYALDGEDVTGEGVKILLDCLFEPLLENSGYAFKESIIATEKQACIDTIESELNEKRLYAVRQAMRLLCEGEPSATPSHGTIEGIEKVTGESAYVAYERLLKTSRVEIVCAGCNDFEVACELFTNAFSKLMRLENKIEDCHSKQSQLKSKLLEHTEVMDVNQSKMVLGFKCDGLDLSDKLKNATAVLMTKIYGGSATSKLFDNVREKMSLCYYCWAKFYDSKGLIIAECGVEKNNIEKAKNEILNQFEHMKNVEGFSDTELNHAVLSLENDLKLVNDSLSGIKSWYLMGIYACDIITPLQAIERIKEVAKNKERIAKTANTIKLDTVYVLTDDNSNTNNESEGIA